MRTTLDIADDVLAAVKELARVEGKTMGDVLSELARTALTAPHARHGGFAEPQAAFLADDWLTFAPRDGLPVSSARVRDLQDDLDLENAEAFDHERQAPRVFPKV